MTKTESERTDIVLLEAAVQDQIFQIRGLNVMLDRDPAALYVVEYPPDQLHIFGLNDRL